MRAQFFAIGPLVVVSACALGGCQDSYASDEGRETHMGDVHAATNPWITAPSASGQAPWLPTTAVPEASSAGEPPAAASSAPTAASAKPAPAKGAASAASAPGAKPTAAGAPKPSRAHPAGNAP